MISLNTILISLVLQFCFTAGLNSQAEGDVGSYSTTGKSSSSSQNTPLCRIVRNLKRSLQEDYVLKFSHELQCGIDMKSNCHAVSCFPDINEKPLGAGFQLNLCDPSPSVDFWVDSTNSTDKWSHRFSVQSTAQREEIVLPNTAWKRVSSSSKNWYLIVNLVLNHSQVRSKSRTHYSYVTLNATLEAWPAIDSLFTFVLINDTRFQLNQLCDLSSAEQEEMLEDSPLPGARAHWMRSLELRSDSSGPLTSVSSQIGQRCDLQSVFKCGIGATCNFINDKYGICECLPGYTVAVNGSCNHDMSPPNPTVQPIPSPNNSAYSSALGALLSILTLVAIAAGIIFAARTGLLSRFRSRLPLQVSSFWPFRRGTAHQVDDQVDMVDPFAHDDDDPPLI